MQECEHLPGALYKWPGVPKVMWLWKDGIIMDTAWFIPWHFILCSVIKSGLQCRNKWKRLNVYKRENLSSDHARVWGFTFFREKVRRGFMVGQHYHCVLWINTIYIKNRSLKTISSNTLRTFYVMGTVCLGHWLMRSFPAGFYFPLTLPAGLRQLKSWQLQVSPTLCSQKFHQI